MTKDWCVEADSESLASAATLLQVAQRSVSEHAAMIAMTRNLAKTELRRQLVEISKQLKNHDLDIENLHAVIAQKVTQRMKLR